ncbi:hypothetical protein B0J11DRAFT_526652 [Dendryphion nanum]|uniref:6-phosphogluconate dehydrogenase C-terminal domain-like protein n=1 Tax=Dendryphion nanum TaxID=256645 RepID=A0A9P9DYM4_9PLEO|nr:hypothetical protein B0J11DRAFT_526652 [Dendryphion nanum]
MASSLANVGILSIGQMGLGVAKLLVAHNYHVLTNVTDRSSATQARAQDAHLDLVENDVELVAKSDYIISIVPPKDAVATANRIIAALKTNPRVASTSPLYYLELNAVSPATVSSIAENFREDAPDVRFIDGGIIGGPPSPSVDSTWKRPGIPLSGPFPLHESPTSGTHLAETLNTKYLGPRIGSASGLKCCFAALSKGFTALALQSFSTAASLDVLPALQHYLDQYNPGGGERAAKGIVGCPSKAYRWVEEMNQIGECFSQDGGWAEQAKVFREIAGVYEGLAKVVEARGGTEGLSDTKGVVGALQNGLKGRERSRRLSVEELEQDDR